MQGNALISPRVYADIRAAIQIDLSGDDIPDEIIAQDQFSGAAERDVLALAARASVAFPSPGDPAYAMLVTAAVQFCAARLASSIPQLTSEGFAAYRYSRVAFDPMAKASQLVQRGLIQAANALGIDMNTLIQPTTMTLAHGGRGDTTRGFRPIWAGTFMGPF